MGFGEIVRLLSYVIPIGGISIVFLIKWFKLKKEHKEDIEKKDLTISDLREKYRELAELEAEKKEVENGVKQTKKDLDKLSDDELDDNYASKLSVMPKKQ